jgi:hypothetical protein
MSTWDVMESPELKDAGLALRRLADAYENNTGRKIPNLSLFGIALTVIVDGAAPEALADMISALDRLGFVVADRDVMYAAIVALLRDAYDAGRADVPYHVASYARKLVDRFVAINRP